MARPDAIAGRSQRRSVADLPTTGDRPPSGCRRGGEARDYVACQRLPRVTLPRDPAARQTQGVSTRWGRGLPFPVPIPNGILRLSAQQHQTYATCAKVLTPISTRHRDEDNCT
ncbi:hypothetical protein GCM10028775_66880 [Catellatospora paridis]